MRLWSLVLVAVVGCHDSSARSSDGSVDSSVAIDATTIPPDPNGCANVFRPDQVSDFYITISNDNLAALEAQFRQPYVTYQQTGQWPDPLPKSYFPLVELSWAGSSYTPVTDAQIRLKGNSSWRHAIELDGDKAKMQFEVSFNETNNNGRFDGLRKIEFDMPRNDAAELRQRVALSYLRRDLGLAAQCASSSRLFINGTYYGAYTTLEHLDKEFLQRNYKDPGEARGDLWEGGADLKTNETTSNPARRDAFYAATAMAQTTPLADMNVNVLEWAAEAMLPDGDGYYGSGHNYYLYDHPTRGFTWLAHDLDSAITFRPATISPLYWSRSDEPPLHYMLVMHDATWRQTWAAALCGPALAAYDVPTLQARIDAWGDQIADSVETDPHYLFTPQQRKNAVKAMHDEVAARKQFITDWCDCFAHGGTDADNDGTPWCLDGDDSDNTVKIGGTELCNQATPLDDDCDGYVDEGCP